MNAIEMSSGASAGGYTYADDWRCWGLSQRLYMVVANGGRLGLELTAIPG